MAARRKSSESPDHRRYIPSWSVVDPIAGHELGEGMLSIPYITPAGVVGIKFRRLDEGTPKYLWPTGQKPPRLE
jgi:hypothetical protein